MSASLYLSKKYYSLLEEWELGMGHWGLGMGRQGDRHFYGCSFK
jgi:hypothetical protein